MENFQSKQHMLNNGIEQNLDEWFDTLDSQKVEIVCGNSLFDYESEETFDEENNCNWDVFYAKSKEIWNTFTLEQKLKKFKSLVKK